MTLWEQFKNDWAGKRVLIMGLGVQGRGVGDAKVFAEAGAKVTVTDLKREDELKDSLARLSGYNIRYVLGRHDEEDFKTANVIIRNPAVSRESPFLKIARDHDVPIKMDSSLFATYYPFPIIGITGTRGKTTTTMMIYEVLKAHVREGLDLSARSDPSRTVFLGGNVPGQATLELLQTMEGSDLSARSDPSHPAFVVLELSSWELEGWEEEKISPHIAVFTNFSEDHLNRYASMEEYFQGKLPITKYQVHSDWFIVHHDNTWTKRAAEISRAQVKWFSSDDFPIDDPLSVPGDHNRANAAAALTVAEILGIDRQDALETLRAFRGVPGRLETIAVIDGVTYVNDTTATTPTATIAALRAIDKPIVLIAGGSSKKLDLKPLASAIVDHPKLKKLVLLYGDGTEELVKLLGRADTVDGVFSDFRRALEQAREHAGKGDVVLLSPGCASFSMFVNEFDRGQQFNNIVLSWQKRR